MSTLDAETRAMLADSVDRFVRDRYGFDDRRHNLREHQGQSPEHWRTFVEMGWLAIPFSEEQGGLGGDITDTLPVLIGFGRALLTEPYLEVLIASRLLSRAEHGEQRPALLAEVLAGESQVLFACDGPGGRGNPLSPGVEATEEGAGYRLNGEKVTVPFAASAGHLLVSARSHGADTNPSGMDLFLLPLDTPGLAVTDYPMMDGHRGANLTFTSVQVAAGQRLMPPGAAGALIQQVHDEGILMRVAEAVGIMEVLVRKTVAYIRTRQQFGVPLSEFQVLRHRLADMHIETTGLANLLTHTAAHWPDADPRQRRIMASRLKACLGPASRYVGQQAVQLHGGIGMTDELDIGHYFKRLTSIELQAGDARWHRKRLWGEMA